MEKPSDEEAHAVARRAFGKVAQDREHFYRSTKWLGWDSLRQDIRYGLRQFRRSPGFTTVAVITLALGIACSATMFNTLEAVALVPLHVRDLDRIVDLRATNLSACLTRSPVSAPAYYDWRQQSHSFEGLAAYTRGTSNLAGISEPARVSVQRVSANFFQEMGIAPALGRTFLPGEDGPGAGVVVVLSRNLWKRSFGSRRDVLGERVRIDGQPATIVGVMPAGFGFPAPGIDLWIPLPLDPARSARTNRYLSVVGLLKPGVSARQAQEEMNWIVRRTDDEHPAAERGWGVSVILVRDQMMKKVALGIAGLLGPGLCVLLIVCANLAGVLLARASARRREIAVRVALGAGRVRLLLQLLTENLLVSLAGGALGLALAYWGIRLVRAFAPATVPRYMIEAIHIDFNVLGFILLVSLLAPLVFGLAPAIEASQLELVESLKEAPQGPALGLRGHHLRDLLVAGEITLAMVLLMVVAVWGKAMVILERVETGFDPRDLLTLEIAPPPSSYPADEQLRAFYGRVLEKAREVPGVQAVAATSVLPASGGEQSNLTQVSLRTGSAPGVGWQTAVVQQSVSPEYFEAMGIPLVAGRTFSAQDSAGAPPVALVSRTMAARFWRGENALGKQLRLGGASAGSPWVTVVGVVGDVMSDRRLGPPLPYVYLPYAQQPTREAALVVRTAGPLAGLARALRSAVQSVDKDLPLGEVETMKQALSLQGPYFMVGLVAVFAFLAMLLAAVGVYGVTSFTVNARTREIGIRMALGAERHSILWLVARQGATFVLAGVGLGALGAIGAANLLRSRVAGVSAADPLALSLSALVLTGAAMLAAYIPARRATKVDPMVALRYE